MHKSSKRKYVVPRAHLRAIGILANVDLTNGYAFTGGHQIRNFTNNGTRGVYSISDDSNCLKVVVAPVASSRTALYMSIFGGWIH